jgi:predicted transcriptional regulator
MTGFKPNDYKITESNLEAVLGSLESQIMEVIWIKHAPIKVREVYEELSKKRKIAYTTVMTTMNILYEKGLLDREVQQGRGGLLYSYWAKMTQEEVEKSVVQGVLDSLMKNFSAHVANYLVENDISDENRINEYKKALQKKAEEREKKK